jgi:hypothetical protein
MNPRQRYSSSLFASMVLTINAYPEWDLNVPFYLRQFEHQGEPGGLNRHTRVIGDKVYKRRRSASR